MDTINNSNNINEINQNIDESEQHINEWIEIFNSYCDYESNCSIKLINLLEIKNNFKNLLGNQDKDDILFYKSLINNSNFYFTNSLKIRQMKFFKDLNNIYFILTNKKFEEINKKNFMIIINDYKKISDIINNSKKKNILLNWIKYDKIESIDDFNNNMYEILNYHLKLISYLSICIDLENEFYCNK